MNAESKATWMLVGATTGAVLSYFRWFFIELAGDFRAYLPLSSIMDNWSDFTI
ncbi:hypothetical protein MHN79_20545 [Vibrio sp. Of14-4]|uniref:hypothetical protein n=1 Tax=Vibrio sp. Of14-4 TaxID=2724878 RepID=UPI001EF301E6|nr:hypothetical protein [Vibrio sp. Of14-4]MCG7491867.1 hypothetical protein [Vibrio sp. Of14-4]